MLLARQSPLFHRLLSKRGISNSTPEPINFDSRQQGVTLLVGCLAGCVGSLVGMGGAFVSLPLLTGYLHLSQHVAHGTSMAAIMLTSLGSTISYMKSKSDETADKKDNKKWIGPIPEQIGHINIPTAICVAGASSIMAMIGARASKKISEKALKISLGVFMLCVAPSPIVRSSYQSITLSSSDTNITTSKVVNIPRLLAIGSFSGVLAGIFGVGGGAVVVPALCVFTDLDYKAALGTSLAAMLPTAVAGSFIHHRQGTMLVRCAVPLGVGSLLGSFIGGKFAQDADETVLVYCFSGLMTFLGSRTLYKALRLVK